MILIITKFIGILVIYKNSIIAMITYATAVYIANNIIHQHLCTFTTAFVVMVLRLLPILVGGTDDRTRVYKRVTSLT